MQDIYDNSFKQLELSIREIGYGDQTINKKMKNYLNLFYSMIGKIHYWETLSTDDKKLLLSEFLNSNADIPYLTDYFDKYMVNLSNNTLNFYIKGVIKP